MVFSAFDESWKSQSPEGAVGGHWGIWDSEGKLKPGREPPFLCERRAPDVGDAILCEGTAPHIEITSVSPYGDLNGTVAGRVCGVRPADVLVAVYIKVAGTWWSKPYADWRRRVRVWPDGTWGPVPIVTGGSDYQATEVRVYLVPAAADVPISLGAGAPPPAVEDAKLDIAVAARLPPEALVISAPADGAVTPLALAARALLSNPRPGAKYCVSWYFDKGSEPRDRNGESRYDVGSSTDLDVMLPAFYYRGQSAAVAAVAVACDDPAAICTVCESPHDCAHASVPLSCAGRAVWSNVVTWTFE
jgi:hypothetical protein